MKVFEVSWEVCNKVGGINTVVRSKAEHMIKFYNDSFYLIGPYFIHKASGEFKEELPPEALKSIFDALSKEGISCRYGKWLIHGNPNTILVDFQEYAKNKNSIKKDLWDNYKVDSLNTEYFDFDEPVIWAYAVGRLLESFSKKEKIVAHCHEWLSAAALLYLKSRKASAATVFTTHATVLGRAMASSNVDLYAVLEKINPEQEAFKFGVNAKFQIERAAAQNAEVFTTVSDITKVEAEKILGRKVDVVLPNGLNLDNFPTEEEATLRYRKFNEKIKEFLIYYFFPCYPVNMHNALIYFICGRYEFRDKGVDIFIKSLGKLNQQLKKEKSEKQIFAFFWIPGNVRGIKPELLENRTRYFDIKDTIDDNLSEIRTEIIHSVVAQSEITTEKILGSDAFKEIKIKTSKFIRGCKNAPLSTHDLNDEENDEIIKAFRQEGLENRPEDNVKVIFYSMFLTGADGLLDTSYYESMIGSDLGVFPSSYEPWGYTPLEAAALRTPSITTDLAGFGRFVQSMKKGKGVYVLKRYGKKDEEVVDSLAKQLYIYSQLSEQDRTKVRDSAKAIAEKADWKIFAKYYKKAHDKALKEAAGAGVL